MVDINVHAKHFISLVQQQSLLWDKNNINFKNPDMKEVSWAQIGKVFGLTGEQASNSFTSLRQKYLRERKKEEAAIKSGVPRGKLKKTWNLIDLLRFLDGVIAPRKSRGEYILQRDTTLSSSVSDEYTGPTGPSFIEITEHLERKSDIEDTCIFTLSSSSGSPTDPLQTPTPSPKAPQKHDPLQMPSSSTTAPECTPEPSSSKRMKRKNEDSERTALISSMEVPIRVETDDSWRVKDDVKAFCKYFGMKLNKLPDAVRSDFENECLSRLHDLEKSLKN